MHSSPSSSSAGKHRGGKPNEETGSAAQNTDAQAPAVQLLSNGRYNLMVSAAGGGYSHFNRIALTRWQEDSTCDAWGAFVYVRDLATGNFWANARQPVFNPIADYQADFSGAGATLRTDTPELSVQTDIIVAQDDDLELRRIRVVNRSDHSKHIDLTSYAEIVLSASAADDAHPAFNKLFIQTEIVGEARTILCHRRPGGADAPAPWLFHALLVDSLTDNAEISYETDRMRFVGRGNTSANPQAIRGMQSLSGTQGSVLDPVAAIRCPIVLKPGQSATVSYIYGVADTRDACLAIVGKYQKKGHVDTVFRHAAEQCGKTLDQLGISPSQAQLYGRLAGSIVYSNASHRADPAIISKNQRGQSGLWGFSVSGDLPIAVLMLGQSPRLDLVHQALQAHAYWRSNGLDADLLIVNAHGIAGRKSLHDTVVKQLADAGQAGLADQRGGIFVRLEKELPSEDLVLFLAVAKIVLDDTAGTLDEQLGSSASVVKTALPSLSPAQSKQLDGPARQMLQAAVAPPAKAPVPASAGAALRPDLVLDNGTAGFTPDGREYVITLAPGKTTPAPWVNILANPEFGTLVSESGCANTWSENAHEFRLTPWSNDPVGDSRGEAFYLRDEDSGLCWSPSPWPSRGDGPYVCRHGFGYSIFEHEQEGVQSELTIYVARDQPVKFAILKINNRSGRTRRLSATGYIEWVLGDLRSKTLMHVTTRAVPDAGIIMAGNAYSTEFGDRHAFFGVDQSNYSFTADRTEFIGRNGVLEHPAAMSQGELSGTTGAALDPCAALRVPFELADGDEYEIVFTLGAGRSQEQALDIARQSHGLPAARNALAEVTDYWVRTLGAVQIETPDQSLDILANGWLVYQTLACRVWGRTAFYQPGGAFGFRDQLQDVMALVHTEPNLVREHLLLSASRQYPEGDVQHWWHPPQGRGVRTRCSDDFLWLALVACRYVATTGDSTVLDEPVHFLTGRPLNADEESYYELPGRSDDAAPLYDHCVRAIKHGFRFGEHGLPLMGTGDWNDGMNKVGAQGKGESVWLAFFLHHVLLQFIPLAQARDDVQFVAQCEQEAAQLRQNLDLHTWDGAWFRRAYFDDGSTLGSSDNTECRIDSIAQSWSVLSQATGKERARKAMDAVEEHLVVKDLSLVKLLAPPFDTSTPDPGYIKAYVPGVRENGGQYTHAAVWSAMAFAALQDKPRTWELLGMLNPLNHASAPDAIQLYKVEPYVVASDVYASPPHSGRGGWTWYSGSAGWFYRLIIESALGLRRQADKLYVEPCIPDDWESYKIRYRYGSSQYFIYVRQAHKARAEAISIDGVAQDTPGISLVDDGQDHKVEIILSGGPVKK